MADAAGNQSTSRSLAIRTYRGNNTLFSFAVLATALIGDADALTISVR